MSTAWMPKTAAGKLQMIHDKMAYREELLRRIELVERDIQRLKEAI